MTRQQKIWLGAKALWSGIKPLLVYLFLPGLCMSAGMIVRGYGKSADDFIKESGNFYTFLSLILIAGLFYFSAKKRGTSFWEESTLFITESDYKVCVWYLIFGVSIGLILSAALTLLPIPEWLIQSYSEKSGFIFQGTDLILVVITVGFLAPLMEEIVFRGLMLNRLLIFFDEKHTVYISSLFFAVCHANILWIIYAFFMGVFLARLAIRKDNILFSVCVHVGFNIPSTVIACIQATNHGAEYFFGNTIIILLYGLIGAVSCRLLFLKLKRGEV